MFLLPAGAVTLCDASVGNPTPSEGVSLFPLPLELDGTVAKRPENTINEELKAHRTHKTDEITMSKIITE